MPLYCLLILIISGSYLFTMLILDNYGEELIGVERAAERPPLFWWYHILCFLNTFFNGTLNMLFIWFAFWDANRRIWLMRQLTGTLNLQFRKKDKTAVRTPTLNFLDNQSLVTWLEMRKLLWDTGYRFQLRI